MAVFFFFGGGGGGGEREMGARGEFASPRRALAPLNLLEIC